MFATLNCYVSFPLVSTDRPQNFQVRASHLPSRAVAKRPVEGVHFDAGVLHGEVGYLRHLVIPKVLVTARRPFIDF